MICNLCKEDKKLIKKSHIIPDFFFTNLYDEKHRLIKFDIIKMYNGENDYSNPPTSLYEKNILCKKCDNEIINNYESYYSKVYHNANFTRNTFSSPEKINHILYENLDYDKANIFFLTILWRAHICTRNEFKNVSLPNDISENIRKQIISGKYDENTVRITALKLSENSNFNRSVTQLKQIENSFSMLLKDMIVFFHIKRDGMYNLIHKHQIAKNGTWVIPEIPKKIELNFLKSYINP
jgi:hypothetical protein